MGLTYAHRNFSPDPDNRTPLVTATDTVPAAPITGRTTTNANNRRMVIALPSMLRSRRVAVVEEVRIEAEEEEGRNREVWVLH